MRNLCAYLLLILSSFYAHSQPERSKQDSIRKSEFLKQIGNGYFPTRYINFDLRYLVKFNQYEGFRTGLGGITNTLFSEKFKLNGYLVYGFRDHNFKYSIGGGFRVSEKHNTWINLSYTNDLQETGSTIFLTDKRLFQFFEPRLLNIDLFHKHITTTLSLEHKLTPNLHSETQLAISNISPTYDYIFTLGATDFNDFQLSTTKIALQWTPLNRHTIEEENLVKDYPRLTLQYTKSFNDVFKGDFEFSKLDFKAVHQVKHKNEALSDITLTTGLANGDAPLTHLYHAYPNNINKETIMNRFSVAGLNSFETMYFNEFFSDKFLTFQFKHYLKPFHVFKRFNPQLVLITRYALGNMKNQERHQNVSFNTLKKGYTESGFEFNKLLFGFGLSCSYRYGAYHLPKFEDNIALKFTFNITL